MIFSMMLLCAIRRSQEIVWGRGRERGRCHERRRPVRVAWVPSGSSVCHRLCAPRVWLVGISHVSSGSYGEKKTVDVVNFVEKKSCIKKTVTLYILYCPCRNWPWRGGVTLLMLCWYKHASDLFKHYIRVRVYFFFNTDFFSALFWGSGGGQTNGLFQNFWHPEMMK